MKKTKKEKKKAKQQEKDEKLGGTLLVSVGHVSLDNDDLDGYQPYLLFECDNVEGQDTLRKGPHRDVQSPQLVPWGVVGGSDITFAVRAEGKFLTVALWDESRARAPAQTAPRSAGSSPPLP